MHFVLHLLEESFDRFAQKSLPAYVQHANDVCVRSVDDEWLAIGDPDHEREMRLIGDQAVCGRSSPDHLPSHECAIAVHLIKRCIVFAMERLHNGVIRDQVILLGKQAYGDTIRKGAEQGKGLAVHA